jgi:hypothetical protein
MNAGYLFKFNGSGSWYAPVIKRPLPNRFNCQAESLCYSPATARLLYGFFDG